MTEIITVYITDTRRFKANAFAEISDWRRQKAEAIKDDKTRLLSFAATSSLDRALIEHGYREKDMVYGVSPDGKPYFENCPLHFSLSHSGFYAAAAVSSSEIGIDVQEIVPCDMRVAKRCFSDEEYTFLETCADRDSEFARIWAMRESAVKLTGEGLKAIKNDYSACCVQTFELEGARLSASTLTKESIRLCLNV